MCENCQDLRDNYTKQNAVFEKSSACRKTKTIVITLANDKESKQHNKKNAKQKHVTSAKRGKTRAAKSRLGLILLLMVERMARILLANHSVPKQNQSKRELLSTLN